MEYQDNLHADMLEDSEWCRSQVDSHAVWQMQPEVLPMQIQGLALRTNDLQQYD